MGAVLALGTTGFGMVLSYGVQVLLARTLGVAGYGIYVTVLGWLNVVQLFAALDLGAASLRYVAVYRRESRWGLLRGFVFRSRSLVIGASAVLAIAVIAVLEVSRVEMAPATRVAALWACGLLPLAALLQLELNILQGFKRVLAARIPNLIVRPAVLGLGVIVAVKLMGAEPTAPVAIAANGLGVFCALAASWWMTRGSMREVGAATPAFATKEWVSTSLGILSVSIAQIVLSQQSDVIVVGSILGPRPAALYSAAGQVASLVSLGVVTVNHLASPMLADAHAGSASALRAVMRRVIRLNWLTSVPIALAVLVVGPYLLRSYGREFSEAYAVLVVLVCAQSIAAAGGALFGTMLTMTGNHASAARVAGTAALVNLGLTLVLTPRFGVLGTATATLVATAGRAVGVYILARRVLRARSD
jgi:O-antigen/teichoic acid export membrane protein